MERYYVCKQNMGGSYACQRYRSLLAIKQDKRKNKG